MMIEQADGTLYIMHNDTLISSDCMFCYEWHYKGLLFELYYNCSTRSYEIYTDNYALLDIKKACYYSFTMNELIENNFPAYIFNDSNDED